jgi:hypothetical protein
MRLKFLVLALVASLVAVSAAVAKDHPNKGKPPTTGANCRPSVKVVLKGVLAPDVDPADGDTSFVLIVKKSNKHGRAYKTAGTAAIMVDAKTRIHRKHDRNLGALAPNDRVSVRAKVCKADLAGGAMPALTARKVDAHAAKAPKPDSGS